MNKFDRLRTGAFALASSTWKGSSIDLAFINEGKKTWRGEFLGLAGRPGKLNRYVMVRSTDINTVLDKLEAKTLKLDPAAMPMFKPKRQNAAIFRKLNALRDAYKTLCSVGPRDSMTLGVHSWSNLDPRNDRWTVTLDTYWNDEAIPVWRYLNMVAEGKDLEKCLDTLLTKIAKATKKLKKQGYKLP